MTNKRVQRVILGLSSPVPAGEMKFSKFYKAEPGSLEYLMGAKFLPTKKSLSLPCNLLVPATKRIIFAIETEN